MNVPKSVKTIHFVGQVVIFFYKNEVRYRSNKAVLNYRFALQNLLETLMKNFKRYFFLGSNLSIQFSVLYCLFFSTLSFAGSPWTVLKGVSKLRQSSKPVIDQLTEFSHFEREQELGKNEANMTFSSSGEHSLYLYTHTLSIRNGTSSGSSGGHFVKTLDDVLELYMRELRNFDGHRGIRVCTRDDWRYECGTGNDPRSIQKIYGLSVEDRAYITHVLKSAGDVAFTWSLNGRAREASQYTANYESHGELYGIPIVAQGMLHITVANHKYVIPLRGKKFKNAIFEAMYIIQLSDPRLSDEEKKSSWF